MVDRASWVRANIRSFQRLLRPLTDRLADKMATGPVQTVGRMATGAEVGTLLGWMSTRVLGQYDLLLVEDEAPDEQDIVYYVGPNILALEKRFAFPPREFRLWLALHEVTHRAQFTGIPWMRDHFLVAGRAQHGLHRPRPEAVRRLRSRAPSTRCGPGRNPLDEGGLVALLASDEQRDVLRQVQGLMSLLEGHGDVTMDRAGGDLIPSAPPLSAGCCASGERSRARWLATCRSSSGSKPRCASTKQGEEFIAAVEAEGGTALLDRAWDRSENLPTLDEIARPAPLDRANGRGRRNS